MMLQPTATTLLHYASLVTVKIHTTCTAPQSTGHGNITLHLIHLCQDVPSPVSPGILTAGGMLMSLPKESGQGWSQVPHVSLPTQMANPGLAGGINQAALRQLRQELQARNVMSSINTALSTATYAFERCCGFGCLMMGVNHSQQLHYQLP